MHQTAEPAHARLARQVPCGAALPDTEVQVECVRANLVGRTATHDAVLCRWTIPLWLVAQEQSREPTQLPPSLSKTFGFSPQGHVFMSVGLTGSPQQLSLFARPPRAFDPLSNAAIRSVSPLAASSFVRAAAGGGVEAHARHSLHAAESTGERLPLRRNVCAQRSDAHQPPMAFKVRVRTRHFQRRSNVHMQIEQWHGSDLECDVRDRVHRMRGLRR